jgi:probable phosphoglycerate mutase
MPDLLRVTLVRLCECEGNVQERVSAYGGLTEIGRRQALATRSRLVNLLIRAWVAPDNPACQETAAILSGEAPVQIANEFKVPPYPQWAGLTLGEVQERWPREWQAYWNPLPGDAARTIVPDGESFQATFQRAKLGLDQLYGKYRGSDMVVIVTHGEVVRLLTVGLLGAPLEHLFRLRGRNGAVSTFDYDGQAAIFECINDTSHLVGLAAKDLANYVARPE